MSEQSTTDFDVSKLGKTDSQDGQPTGDETDDLISQLVGEGKKFKSLKELAKGKLDADSFIETLKTENKALRESLGTTEDAVEKLLERVNKRASTQENERTTTPSDSNHSTSESLTEEKLFGLLDKRERVLKAKENVSTFNEKVKNAFGEKAHSAVSTRLSELGIDADLFTMHVERNPNAALALLGLNKESAGSTAMREASVNTEAFLKGGDAGVENHSYFSKLRKEMGVAFYRPEVQQRLVKARKQLGDDFWK